MRNVETTVDKGILTIKVDLSKVQGPSKSGKTQVIASSDGNADLADLGYAGVKFGLNVYK